MGNSSGCFNPENMSCQYNYSPCSDETLHPEVRYSDSSAAWVLTAAIIVFFMKAGFMMLEVSFARSPEERRYVVVLKYQDAFASAFGFFLCGFDCISQYLSVNGVRFFTLSDPNLWFFKFTFASNAATIVGGCLVTNKYKLRMPAAFVSAFVISGIIHPAVARIIWSDKCDTLSPYRFCNYRNNDAMNEIHNCSDPPWNCMDKKSFGYRLYILDFAGGGAVHLIGGVAGLVICLFAKLNERRFPDDTQNGRNGIEYREKKTSDGFWDWMYPSDGGQETVSDAALGVLILWFSWFAFNCGSTESIEVGYKISEGRDNSKDHPLPFYGIPAVIAINMIMAGAAGGIVAVAIAIWAQVRYRTSSLNANHIANGVLSALVSITAGCAFVDYWGAILIGAISIVVYHLGCYLEYRFKIEDTAQVFPVHGLCGLWSLIGTGLFLFGDTAQCNLHAAYEGLCYCNLRLPQMNYIEQLGAQIIGALIMIGIGLGGSLITYSALYIVPISPFVRVFDKIFFLSPKGQGGQKPHALIYKGGWLLTHPDEDFSHGHVNEQEEALPEGTSTSPLRWRNAKEEGETLLDGLGGQPHRRTIPDSQYIGPSEEMSMSRPLSTVTYGSTKQSEVGPELSYRGPETSYTGVDFVPASKYPPPVPPDECGKGGSREATV